MFDNPPPYPGYDIGLQSFTGLDGSTRYGFTNYLASTFQVSDTKTPTIEVAEELNRAAKAGYITNDTGGQLQVTFNDVGSQRVDLLSAGETWKFDKSWDFLVTRIRLVGVSAGVLLNVRVFMV